MKKFVSLLLAAILVFASISVTAFAAESDNTVNPGDTVDIPVTVSGPVSSFKVRVSSTDVLTVNSVKDSSGAATVNGNIIVWSSAENVNSYTFYVNVTIADNASVGTHYVGASVEMASKVVAVEEDTEDGVADGVVRVNLSATGSVTIEEPACVHQWDDGVVQTPAACEDDGVMLYTCALCGETKPEAIPATGHTWNTTWSQDADKHWHECSACDAIKDEGKHKYEILVGFEAPTEEKDGYRFWECVCGRGYTEVVEYNEPPKVGDIRPMMVLGFGAVLFTLAAGVYVFKRKVNF